MFYWTDYCKSHLKLLKDVLSDAKLSLRMYPNSKVFITCDKVLNIIIEAETRLNSYGYLCIRDLAKLFGTTYLWCHFFGKYVDDDPIRHKIELLENQCLSQVRKNNQRYNQKVKSYNYTSLEYYD